MEREVIMVSPSGDFTLVKEEGIGINDTPWSGLKVISSGNAEKHVVEIRLNTGRSPNFDGNPVQWKYVDTYIAHGMRSVCDTYPEIEEYIEVLQEAVDFGRKINHFIEQSDEWRY